MRTVTGIGTWRFRLDFDRDGEVTGEYRMWSENDASSIPREMAKSISNEIRAYLYEADDLPDIVTTDMPLDLAIEIEKVRQGGSSIRREAEAAAQMTRKAASREAEETKAAAREYYEQTVSLAHEKAEEIEAAARVYYEQTVSSANKEAEAIRSQATADANAVRSRATEEAEMIQADAERIAEERREMRARRKAFVFNHIRLIAVFFVALISLSALGVIHFRQEARARYEAKLIPVNISSEECAGVQYREMEARLATSGFTNISCIAVADLDAGSLRQEEATRFVTIDGIANFHPDDQFPYDAEVEVYYLTAQQLHAPVSSRDAIGMDVHSVERAFADAGFAIVSTEAVKDLIVGFREKPYTVSSITVNGDEAYLCSDTLRPDVEVVIYYHDYSWSH